MFQEGQVVFTVFDTKIKRRKVSALFPVKITKALGIDTFEIMEWDGVMSQARRSTLIHMKDAVKMDMTIDINQETAMEHDCHDRLKLIKELRAFKPSLDAMFELMLKGETSSSSNEFMQIHKPESTVEMNRVFDENCLSSAILTPGQKCHVQKQLSKWYASSKTYDLSTNWKYHNFATTVMAAESFVQLTMNRLDMQREEAIQINRLGYWAVTAISRLNFERSNLSHRNKRKRLG
jgi:hypothetical protein